MLDKWYVYYDDQGILKISEEEEKDARIQFNKLDSKTNKILYHEGQVIERNGTVGQLITEANAEYNKAALVKPKDIKIKTEYQFTRSQPASSTVVSKKHDLILYN